MDQQSIQKDLMAAMKAKDETRVSTLRMLMAKIKNAKIDLGKELEEADVVTLVKNQVKQRKEAIDQYRANNRNDLADKEQAEMNILQEYLPKQIGGDALVSIIDAAISTTGATSPKDMGAVMKEINSKYAGQVDGKEASALVRRKLGN